MSEFYPRVKQENRGILLRCTWRALLVAILVISAAAFPWWVSGAIAIFGILQFPLFLEAVLAALIYDSLFGIPVLIQIPFIENFTFQYFFFTGSLIVIFLVEMLKKRVRR